MFPVRLEDSYKYLKVRCGSSEPGDMQMQPGSTETLWAEFSTEEASQELLDSSQAVSNIVSALRLGDLKPQQEHTGTRIQPDSAGATE